MFVFPYPLSRTPSFLKLSSRNHNKRGRKANHYLLLGMSQMWKSQQMHHLQQRPDSMEEENSWAIIIFKNCCPQMAGRLPRVLVVNATDSLWPIFESPPAPPPYYNLWEAIIINSDCEIGGKGQGKRRMKNELRKHFQPKERKEIPRDTSIFVFIFW